jgi:hypothetical protein
MWRVLHCRDQLKRFWNEDLLGLQEKATYQVWRRLKPLSACSNSFLRMKRLLLAGLIFLACGGTILVLTSENVGQGLKKLSQYFGLVDFPNFLNIGEVESRVGILYEGPPSPFGFEFEHSSGGTTPPH